MSQKISEVTEATSLEITDVLPLGRPLSNEALKVSMQTLSEYIVGNIFSDAEERFELVEEAVTTHEARIEETERKATIQVESVYALLSINTNSLVDGQQIIVKGYHPDSDKGGGVFWWDATRAKSTHNGGTIISPTVPWDGTQGGFASYTGAVTTGDDELPVGITTGGYAAGHASNITNVKTRLPVMGGFLGGAGDTDPSGNGCFVRRGPDAYSFCNFGAKGDADFEVDGTDDSYAMLQAVRSVPKRYGRLVAEPGYYTHGSGDNRVILLYMEGYRRLVIDGHGAVIQSHSSNPALVANAGFWWIRCKYMTVNGLKFDGRLDVRTPIVGDANQVNKQHGFNIGLTCERITLNDCEAVRCLMDGVFVGGSARTLADGDFSSPEKIYLNNIISEYNYRQGLSISRCIVMRVKGGSYSYTGRLGVGKGTSPMAGIDSESEGVALGNNNFGLVIDGVKAVNNAGAGVSLSLGSYKSRVTGSCYIADNGAYGVAATATSYNCIIDSNLIKGNGSENSTDGCDIYNLGYDNEYRCNRIEPTVKAILDIAVVGVTLSGDGSVYDGNIITNVGDVLEAGYIDIRQARQYTNNKHYNLQSAIAGHAVNITAPRCVVTGNEGINTNAVNTFGFMRVNQAAVVKYNHSTGYPLVIGAQIYIRPAATSGKVLSYGPNFEDDSPKVGQSIGGQIGTVDYPAVFHNGRRLGSGTAVPTTGDWKQGDIFFRSNASATTVLNSNSHWVCTTSGSFGAVTATGDITTGTKLISNLSNLTNINVGCFLTVAGAGITNSEVTKVDIVNNIVTVTNNATGTVVGAAISVTSPVFMPKGYQAVKGSTASRPAPSSTDAGILYFDTTLVTAGKPIWWTGTAWVDSTGTVV